MVLGSTHGRTTLSVACPHRPCTAHLVRRHRAWKMARSKQCRMMSSITCNHRTSEVYMVRRRLALHAISPLESTHDRTTSSVAFDHRPWRAHTIALRRAWHAIIALGQHTQLDDVGRGIPSSSLESIHDRTTLGMACYHQSWTTHMIGSLRVWHAHMALGQHTRSDYVVCDMPSQPLSSTHG